jgi:hypothetical protein
VPGRADRGQLADMHVGVDQDMTIEHGEPPGSIIF